MTVRLIGRFWPLASMIVFVFALGVGRSAADGPDEGNGPTWFVHATDLHIFVSAARNTDKDVKALGETQEELNRKALKDMLQRIRSLPPDDGPPSFIVLTGGFGLDPCSIQKVGTQPPAQAPATKNEKAKATNGHGGASAKDCMGGVDPDKRNEQIEQLAEALGASPVPDIYLAAGNGDVAREAPSDAALGYFNQLIEDVQKKILDNKSDVQLHNLTSCYVSGGSPSACYADIAGTSYRLIGFPSYSFGNANADSDNADAQMKQFDIFRGLLDRAQQSGKKALVVTDLPEIDDPYALAQDRYAGKPPAKATDEDPDNPRSPWSTWNVSKKLLDNWDDAAASDSVAGILAGHIQDSHKEIYRPPYAWSTINDHRTAVGKLFLAPPLSVVNQDTSPIQARGFALMRLEPDRIESRLFWYNSETGDFVPDAGTENNGQRYRRWRLPRAIVWLWQVAGEGEPLERLAVLLIALVAAFLTIVQIWNLPPAENPLAASSKSATSPAGKAASDASSTSGSGAGKAKAPGASVFETPFSSQFGKTVLSGLGGLAATTVLDSLENKNSSSDKEYYIVCFVIFFFLLLIILALLRATAEAVRSRVVMIYHPLARPPFRPNHESAAKRRRSMFWDWFTYCVKRSVSWLVSLRVPLLTFVDTFVNLTQGKNQTNTRVLSDSIIDQQRNVIRVASAIRQQLNTIIYDHLKLSGHDGSTTHRRDPQDVRVSISVLSADQTEVFYIARSPGSAPSPFSKRSVAWVSVFTGKILWYKKSYEAVADKIILFDNRRGTIPDDDDTIFLKSHYQFRDGDYDAFVVFPVPRPQRGFGSQYVKGAIHISFRRQEDFERFWRRTETVTTPVPEVESKPETKVDPTTKATTRTTTQTTVKSTVEIDVEPKIESTVNPTTKTVTQTTTQTTVKTTPTTLFKIVKIDKVYMIDIDPLVIDPEDSKPDRIVYTTPDLMLDSWCQDDQVRATLLNSVATLGELLRVFNEILYKAYIASDQAE